MENMLKEQEHQGRVEVDKTSAQRLTSELLPRIAVSRTPKAKPPRPATPVKKSGERLRRRIAATSASGSGSSANGGSMLPLISSQVASPVEQHEYLYEDTVASPT